MVNSIKWPIQWEWQVDADFNHNLFYNVHSMGEFPKDKIGQDIDGQAFGIFNMELLPKKYTDTLGYPEAERKVNLRNNNWYYSSEVTDYWASIDSLEGEPFMNERTQGMFDDDNAYPNLIEESTMNLDPGFANAGDPAVMVQWIKDLRDTSKETTYWGFDPDNDRFGITWPLPEDLSYTNATLLTAADGFPVGDLNWFPDKKEEWITGVEVDNNNLVNKFELAQNYPNPFNPSTTINYTIPKNTNVAISIYNAIGQKVVTLVNKKQAAGSYSVNWNGKDSFNKTLSSGIYFYQLNAGDFIQARKMILLK
jgi:hypothetical protein